MIELVDMGKWLQAHDLLVVTLQCKQAAEFRLAIALTLPGSHSQLVMGFIERVITCVVTCIASDELHRNGHQVCGHPLLDIVCA